MSRNFGAGTPQTVKKTAPKPGPAGEAYNRAVQIYRAGDLPRALELARAGLAGSAQPFSWQLLTGVILWRLREHDQALAHLEEARRLQPRRPEPFVNLGNLHLDRGDGPAAEAAFRRAIERGAGGGEMYRLLGVALRMQGKTELALAAARKAAHAEPGDIRAVIGFVDLLVELRRHEEALAFADPLCAADDRDEIAHLAKARVLKSLGRHHEAITLLESFAVRVPGCKRIFQTLGTLWWSIDRARCNAAYEAGLAIDPDDARILVSYCDSLNRSRYGREADHIARAYEVACRYADQVKAKPVPGSKPLRDIFCRMVDFERLDALGARADCIGDWLREHNEPGLLYEFPRVETMQDRLDLVEFHRQWGAKVEARAPAAPAHVAGPRGDRLRVGFLSSDLRDHPVSYFAQPLFEHFDRGRVEVFGYSFYQGEADPMQQRIASQITGFRWWPRRPDHEVAAGIAADRLDILFELGGTTDMNRVELMAWRPARLQASWLGYPHSAGLSRIDYLLVDPFLNPTDPRLLIEKPLVMPESWIAYGTMVYQKAEITRGLPEERAGRLTFGTMNNPYKYSRPALSAWAEVLKAVPGSRFLFVRPESDVPAFQASLRRFFEARGVAPERLDFIGVRGRHMPFYNEIDIALDPLPHVGGTTTCECLWMGVPVVSLAGPALYERLSHSILNNAGLPDLSVTGVEDFVAKAVELAGDRERRRHLRENLRRMMVESPLGQLERFADAFYRTVEKVAG